MCLCERKEREMLEMERVVFFLQINVFQMVLANRQLKCNKYWYAISIVFKGRFISLTTKFHQVYSFLNGILSPV